GQAESQGYAEQPDSHLGERCRDHGASTATEGQPERANRLGRKTLSVHGNPPLRAPPRRYIEAECYYKVRTDFSAALLTHCATKAAIEPLRPKAPGLIFAGA